MDKHLQFFACVILEPAGWMVFGEGSENINRSYVCGKKLHWNLRARRKAQKDVKLRHKRVNRREIDILQNLGCRKKSAIIMINSVVRQYTRQESNDRDLGQVLYYIAVFMFRQLPFLVFVIRIISVCDLNRLLGLEMFFLLCCRKVANKSATAMGRIEKASKVKEPDPIVSEAFEKETHIKRDVVGLMDNFIRIEIYFRKKFHFHFFAALNINNPLSLFFLHPDILTTSVISIRFLRFLHTRKSQSWILFMLEKYQRDFGSGITSTKSLFRSQRLKWIRMKKG